MHFVRKPNFLNSNRFLCSFGKNIHFASVWKMDIHSYTYDTHTHALDYGVYFVKSHIQFMSFQNKYNFGCNFGFVKQIRVRTFQCVILFYHSPCHSLEIGIEITPKNLILIRNEKFEFQMNSDCGLLELQNSVFFVVEPKSIEWINSCHCLQK